MPTGLLSGQVSHVSGSGKDFADDSLIFFTYHDPLFNIKYPASAVKVAEDGTFSFVIDPGSTQCLYVETGPYLGYFFIRPGHSYKIELPRISGLSDEWRHNPYFKKALRHLQTICTSCGSDSLNEINQAIRKFDEQYDPFRDKQLLRYYSPSYSRTKLDSFETANPVPPGIPDSMYYSRYRFYRLGILEFTVNAYNADTLISKYFSGRRVDFGLPPYLELFNQVFDDYFQHLSKEPALRDIYKVFSHISYNEIKSYLSTDPVMRNDTLFESVLLDEIYQSYYSGDFPKERMVAFADTIKEESRNTVIRDMADTLIKKFNWLQPGQPAPGFQLKDVEGNIHSLSDFRGKYVYLGFCETQSMICLREFEYLKALSARHASYLSVITIIRSDDLQNVKQFITENKLNWTILIAGQEDHIFQAYNVRALPVFYLIGKEGKLVKSPAADPSAGIEQVLFRVMKDSGDI